MKRPIHVIALLALLALLAWAPAATAQTNAGGAWSFVSSPRLHPPSVRITTNSPGTAPGYVFLAPIVAGGKMLGAPGPLIVDNQGNPVYSRPLPRGLKAANFRAQTYRGQPVLTWWQGTISSQGIGNGTDVILDSSYHVIATVRAGNGYTADLHEFVITPQNTALISAYKQVRLDLSGCCHGSRNGVLWDSVVQEVDIATGRVLWQWDPLQHVRLRESYTVPVSGMTWDPYHLNSIDLDSAGNVLVSMRNTWAVYKIRQRTGGIYWRLGGKATTFKLEPGVRFAWQHNATFQSNGNVALFDDEAAPKVGSLSRGLVVRLDTVHRAAHVAAAYTHPGVLAGSQGSTEVLPNGNVFEGWGQVPYFSEYTSDERLVFDGHFHGQDESYRAYRMPWVGRPTHGPALTVSGSTLYGSWNGETGIARWQVLAGPSASQLSSVGTVASRGFETTIDPRNPGPYFQLRALDAAGGVLGSSAVVHE